MRCYAPSLVFVAWALLLIAKIADPASEAEWAVFLFAEAVASAYYIHQVRSR